jgi:2-polyprenyl-3-methyl-5-hydroxy-6-metoxy-1,4-benzoquinol methylase
LIRCPSCKFESREIKKISYPAFSETAECVPSDILVCTHCGLGFAIPMPSEQNLQNLYQNNQYWGDRVKPLIHPKNFLGPFVLAESRWQLLVQQLPKWDSQPVIKILDLGAGQGCFGMVASKYLPGQKIEYFAVEPDAMMRDSLKASWKNVDSKIQLHLHPSLNDIKQKFQIIVLSHILEHISDPVNLLTRLNGFIEQDGILFVDVPNQDHLFKKNVFPHLLFFSPESLKYVFEISGYLTISVRSWGRDRESTPLNENIFSFFHIIEKVILKARKVVPLKVLMAYFYWHFGIKKSHLRGTWIRAIGKLK